MRKIFPKYQTKQEIEGEQAYAKGLSVHSNPYDPVKQPTYSKRWLKGYLETKRLCVL